MRIESLEDARAELARVLSEWEAGSLETPWHVQDTAEEVERQFQERRLLRSQKEIGGIAAIVHAALDLLTNAQAQYVLPADIPTFKVLLTAAPGTETAAIETYRRYWEAVDYGARQAAMEQEWFR